MQIIRGAACAALLMLVCSAAPAAPISPAELRDDARRQRESGNFKAAIESLHQLMESGAASPDDERLLAETLAWDKQFEASETIYRRLLSSHPSDSARLGLARVLLWTGRYAEARTEFARLTGADALEGRATAAYWAGDLRSAVHDFRQLIAVDPARTSAQKSLDEIASSLRPTGSAAVFSTHDDQPFESLLTEIAANGFAEPLTRWSVSLAGWRLYSPDDDGRVSHASHLIAGFDTAFPWQRIHVAATAGALRLPGSDTEFVGSVSTTLQVRRSRFQIALQRRELLTNPAERYGVVDDAWLEWSYDNGSGTLASARAQKSWYFDDNSGVIAYAYGIRPLLRRERSSVWAGASTAYRDTDESRFYPVAVSSSLQPGNFFTYQYRGRYIPYWTPRDLREVRLIVGGEMHWHPLTLRLQADGGFARDLAQGLGPDSGPGPFPPFIQTFEYDRSFKPYRGSAFLSVPLTRSLTFETGFEHNRTADYQANTIHAVVRRH